MLRPEVLKKIKKIQLRAGHLASDALAGEYHSAFKGLGMEFDEVREYQPGDDVRNIDWNVTARTGVPHIKTFKEEREMTVILMVDCSSSLLFGTTGRMHSELAAEFAAIVAFIAIKNNDKVGLLIFSDHVESFIPPKKGRAHVWNIIRSVMTHEKKGTGTNISGALEYLLKITKRRSMAFLISDFIDEGYASNLKLTARRHDLICAHFQDSISLDRLPSGFVDLQDLESQQTTRLFRWNFPFRGINSEKQTYEDSDLKIEAITKQIKAGYIKFERSQITNNVNLVDPLLEFLKKRELQR